MLVDYVITISNISIKSGYSLTVKK